MFIVAICPAGTTSNALTFVGRGNVALAVVLTALSSLVTVFTIPLLLSWALPWFLAEGGGTVPSLSIPTTIRQLATITLIPVVVGMLVRRFLPDFADRLVPVLRPVAFVILVGVIVFAGRDQRRDGARQPRRRRPGHLGAERDRDGWSAGCSARRSAPTRRDSMTLAIEIGVHNVTLAIFLTLTVLHSLPLALTQNVYGVVMLFNGTIFVRLLRDRMIAEAKSEALA